MILNYREFLLLEYEGGPASHQPVKVSDGMIVDIDPDDEGEEEEDKDIDILHDMSEGIDIEDPYDEEIDGDLPVLHFSGW